MDLSGRSLGPYLVLSRLGAGGMGEVWLARDPRLEREVALKLLPRGIVANAEQLVRFRREALALAALNHPNIATIHGLESAEDGTQVLVMEHIEGTTLAARLAGGPLPPDEALRVGARIAEALEVAHERGVVHRDLKPGNVMLGPRGIVKVLDFGIARAAGRAGVVSAADATMGPSTMALEALARKGRPAAAAAEPTPAEAPTMAPGPPPLPPSGAPVPLSSVGPVSEEGAVSGTPGYMSPEQANGEPQDHRTDVFAFGCVLYECLSGRRAFLGTSAWDTIERTLRSEPDLSVLPASAPDSVRALVARCLVKSPAGRPDSMRAIREQLESALGNAPGTAPAAETPHNLPRAVSSFVGRATELATADAHLDRGRLLTLTGVGGCGKTRLALELAGRRLARHPGGVWFADLARLAEADRVPEAVAAALGVREEAGRALTDVIAAYLAPRRALLVLDNCEHVLGACAELVTVLLEAAPGLNVLATSREGLGVSGETLQAVPSLSLPARGAGTLAALGASEAVHLFVERATAAQSGFSLDESNAAAIAEICRRLDGIPLALELAAARIRVLSAEQIRERLDDRFRLLTGGSRTALPRHQTLRAALHWSWDQLHDAERDLMRTLAVFAGGWTFDAVAAVTPEEDDEFEVLDLLTRLVDKSLVVVERDARGHVRYRFLESVRQFALEQLDERGGGAELRHRHLDHFLRLAESSERHLTGPRQGEWFERLDQEQENLLAALAWTTERPDGGSLALRLAGSVWRFWSARGHYELGRRALADALSRPGADAPTPERARALVRAGGLALYQGDWNAARPLIEQSLELYRALGDDSGVARALAGLSIVATYVEDDATAERTNRESLELYRRLGQTRGMALAHHSQGYLAWCRGDHEEARRCYEQALELVVQVGDRETQALTLAGLAEAQFRLGNPDAARGRYAESLQLARELGARREACYGMEGCADLAAVAGAPGLAVRLLSAADALRRELGTPPVPREQRERDAVLERLRAALGAAAFDAEWSAGRELGFEGGTAAALDWLSLPAR